MLKNTEFIYEGEDFKIINPDKGLKVDINEKIQEYTSEDGNLDIDNENLKLYLLKTLVQSENEDYQFVTMSLDDIKDIEQNPSTDYQAILYFIGNIVSDIIIENYRKKILDLKELQMQLLQSETLSVLDSINGDIQSMTDRNLIEEEKKDGILNKIKNIFK